MQTSSTDMMEHWNCLTDQKSHQTSVPVLGRNRHKQTEVEFRHALFSSFILDTLRVYNVGKYSQFIKGFEVLKTKLEHKQQTKLKQLKVLSVKVKIKYK